MNPEPNPIPLQSRVPTLMVQGCTSDAGKSVLVAAFCRLLARRKINVAPFKPQNMALNSAVTEDGGEIGRAQALQALAAGIAPHTDFNPVLLKPSTDKTSQVILHGKVATNMNASDYHHYKPVAMQAVLASWQRLQQRFQWIMVEGAGSPAEINLRSRDIANMGFAEKTNCPVIIVADIDRGGVFAHLVGTLELLSDSEKARVLGFVINRFRGDIALLEPGLQWLENRTGKPVLGVLPYLHGLFLDAEDTIRQHAPRQGAALRVIAPMLPRASNHNDLDPLQLHPDVNFSWIGPEQPPPPCDLVILPGSKSVRSDLAALRKWGWEAYLIRHLRYGGKVLGLCGGYQMLGKAIHDPLGIEGSAGSLEGLGWLDMETTLESEKQLRNVTGFLDSTFGKAAVRGYEIHMGVSRGEALKRPLAWIHDPRSTTCPTSNDGPVCHLPEGARSPDGQVAGTYCHGLFDHAEALSAILKWAGHFKPQCIDYSARREADLDRVADAVESAIDVAKLFDLCRNFQNIS